MSNVGKLCYKHICKKLLLLLLVVAIVVTGLNLETAIIKATTTDNTSTTQIYLVDNTKEKWLDNDDAKLELVDNSNGHKHYKMTKINNITWSATVPVNTYNITFNRYSSDNLIQWNSWSAGGRDDYNAYYVDGSEYGHWENNEIDDEHYFHAGDIIYLDISEFALWKKDNAKMYINFTDASKKENGGNDIAISRADKRFYNPKIVGIEVTENIYAYVVTFEDEGKTELRFWRGNDYALWNCSIVLAYDDFVNGVDCIKIGDWNDVGKQVVSQYKMNLKEDTDGDGLNDYNEWAYGTDVENVDSDTDGLLDYEEVAVLGTNALHRDTNGNGILDSEEDADGDGLANVEECKYGTSNCTRDTDGDKIADYDEIKVYKTNPLDKDTDGDGADDKWEIDKGFDANISNSNFNITEKEQGVDTSVKMELIGNGECVSSFKMGIHDEDGMFISSLLPGYIGSAYDFEITGQFEVATLTFYFDESNLEIADFNPTIYYYNNETRKLEEIQTNWDKTSNYVTAQLSHFSTYLLLNKAKYEQVWEKEIKKPNGEGIIENNMNIAFVVDLSGSMGGTKLDTTKAAIKSFIDILEKDDLASIISFTDSAHIRCGLTCNKDTLIASVNSMTASGGTAIHTGIKSALDVLRQNTEHGYDIVIVFTDGYDEPSKSYEKYYQELVEEAIQEGITIYTIGIQTVDENLLKIISRETGGNYYYASIITELQDKLDMVKKETIDYMKDSNNDGISDYYTKLICNGTLRLPTGSVIAEFIGNYDEIQKDADYDKDGLLNGEEINVVETYGRIYMELLSDPTNTDYDKDNIGDFDERKMGTNPFMHNASKIDVNYLFNNDIYVASLFSEDYDDDWVIRGQLGLGNLIMNFKTSYVNDYKQALLQFVELYNKSMFDDTTLEYIKDVYESSLNGVLQDLANYALVLNDVAFELDGYAEAISLYEKSLQKIMSLEKTLKAIKDYKSMVGFSDELNTICLNIKVQFLEQQSKNLKAKEAMESSKLIGKLEERMANFVHKLPSKVRTAIKGIKAFNNFITYGIIVVDTGMDVLETLDLYASIDVGLTQYVELDEFLESIILYSNNDDLILAATDVRYALSNDLAKSVSEIVMIVEELYDGGYTATFTYALLESGPIGWAIYLGWSLGDLMGGTSTVNEELLKVIAYGDANVSYAKYLKSRLVYQNNYYYLCDESILKELQILGQLRVVGEDKYASAQSERGFLKMWIDGMFGDTQEDIEENCRDTIDTVVRKCNKFNVPVYKNFLNAYLNCAD